MKECRDLFFFLIIKTGEICSKDESFFRLILFNIFKWVSPKYTYNDLTIILI
ncbi:hypothetical protein GLOIN_2v1617034 [Rhizophagus irregularis DAOM 181602=DAOM 197198]|uniref:Uncharacterized protein n=1 Tax=Rhizophagus irregularis (strain DAOM 181602 / DAOM 197198 / MUCL 43194) TaxID=747089 RepID=A0A2P4PY97_RHIID|nr:hypothetical protein GLOIN_2v1617034 [Rhizophagus irregularis DAOM 181602=DAOM 197198]POG70354.1 hypothetical protein GLOIN_2v1617034 [Rhizophagus irregularis DAOM 181602=DAOM 197198]|eukprot:XP_025177220.1 hypothetical protein GLOIN_2v1617034 [Rhizophagus irregularis DAOM 181602=DAOM 197198]